MRFLQDLSFARVESCSGDVLTLDLPGYTLDFTDSRSQTLVVTFEPAGGSGTRPNRRRAGWGVEWLSRQGISSLAIKPINLDWYRGKDLHQAFRSLQEAGFFRAFEKVLFYGTSMGGYGALVFSRAAPGSSVLSFSPQTTLDPIVVPWEKRFPNGSNQDWTGDFLDGAQCYEAGRVAICYDPFSVRDRRHVDRISREDVLHLHVPFSGHMPISMLARQRVLSKVVRGVLDGNLTTESFAQISRCRRFDAEYWFIACRNARTFDKAMGCLYRAEELKPKPGLLASDKARIHAKFGRVIEAGPFAEEALQAYPKRTFLREILADSFFAQGMRSEGVASLIRALELDPSNVRLKSKLKTL